MILCRSRIEKSASAPHVIIAVCLETSQLPNATHVREAGVLVSEFVEMTLLPSSFFRLLKVSFADFVKSFAVLFWML